MVSLGQSSSYHSLNHSDYRSASVKQICNPENVIRICNIIDFGLDWLRMDQDLPFAYEGQFIVQHKAPYLL